MDNLMSIQPLNSFEGELVTSIEDKLVFIIDFSWLYYRSRFAFSSLSFLVDNVKYATGTIYGVYDALITIMENYGKTIDIILCMDGNPQKQNKLSDSYKSGRESSQGSMDLLDISKWDVAKAFTILSNVSLAWHPNQEADDTMAFFAKVKRKEDKVILFSGDGDLRQLISSKDRVFCAQTYKRGDGYIFEDEDYLWKNGIKGSSELTPNGVPLYLAIVGDASDNVQGIPRFKTAVAKEIANEVKTIDGLRAFLESDRTSIKYSKECLILKENLSIVERNYKMINLDPLYLPRVFKRNDFEGIDLKYFDKYGCTQVYNDLLTIIG